MLWKLVAGTGCVVMAVGLGASAAPASRPVPSPAEDTCEEVGRSEPTGNLNKTTVPPDGSEVEPGTPIEVTLEWDASDLRGALLHKALDCVWVDGRLAPPLSTEQRGAPNDGRFRHRYVVPPDLPAGSTVCDRGFISGPVGDDTFARHTSKKVCFTVKSPVPVIGPTPPAPPVSAPPASASGPPPPDRPAESVPDARAPLGPEVPGPPPVSAPLAAPAVAPAPPALAPVSSPLAPAPPVLPTTGGDARRLIAAAGADLTFAGLALIGGARRRARRSSP